MKLDSKTKKTVLKQVNKRLSSDSQVTRIWLNTINRECAATCERIMAKHNVSFPEALWYVLKGRPMCPVCKTKPRSFRGSWNQGFSKTCSSKCTGQIDEVKQKRRKTNLKRYGETSPTKVPSIRKKQKRTMVQRYGVPFSVQCPELLEKQQSTFLKNFPGGRSDPKFQAIIRATNIERYGVEHRLQNREAFEAQQISGFKIRDSVIGGKLFRTRGFEEFAIAWLVSTMKIKPKNIHTTAKEGVPSIKYYDKELKRDRIYHPDILVTISDRQYIIEVKSTYTCGLLKRKSGHQSGSFERIKTIAQAVEDAGYKFKLIIVSKHKKNKKVALINSTVTKTKRSVRAEFNKKTGLDYSKS